MPKPTAKKKKGFWWFLPQSALKKTSITINDVDVKDFLDIDAGIRIVDMSIRQGVGQCSFALVNDNGRFIDLTSDGLPFIYDGGEVVKIGQDFASGTTRVFKGKLLFPYSFQLGKKHMMGFVAQKVPELVGDRINFIFSGTGVNAVHKLIDDNLSDVITYSSFDANLGSSEKTVDIELFGTPGEILSEIFIRAEWDGRLDNDPGDTGKFDLTGFVLSTDIKKDFAFQSGVNIVGVPRFGTDYNTYYNAIKVIGGGVGGANVLWYEDSDFGDLWKKTKEVRNSAILSTQSAADKSSSDLSRFSNTGRSGSISGKGYPGVFPGSSYFCNAQRDGVYGYFRFSRIEHSITKTWNMTVSIDGVQRRKFNAYSTNKKISDISSVDNPNNMIFSYPFDFDSTTNINLSASPTVEVSDGFLKLKSGNSSGTMQSDILTLTENVTKADMVLQGPLNFSSSVIRASNDSGANSITLTEQKTSYTFPAPGNKIIVYVDLGSSIAKLDGVTVRFK